MKPNNFGAVCCLRRAWPRRFDWNGDRLKEADLMINGTCLEKKCKAGENERGFGDLGLSSFWNRGKMY